MADTVGIQTVKVDELEEIEKRRQEASLGVENVEDNLIGLALSGGALRAASFSMGFVQALQRLGLWKFIDYMSTVSGGGYIGGYLTSSTLHAGKSPSREYQPLNDLESEKQRTRVLRFIYGGRFLLSPWRLANSYLFGLVAINLAILSGATVVCSSIALLWRMFDMPFLKDRLEMLLPASDHHRAFWPFYFFTLVWLVSWGLSLYRNSAEKGTVARYLLAVPVTSFLIGMAILVGNGDVSGITELMFGKQGLPKTFWGAILAVVFGGLLPFLNPKRLLKSGFDPQHAWERYVFAGASAFLLVGLPLVLVGTIGRENISHFNTDPYRPIVPGDIQDIDALCVHLSADSLASITVDLPTKSLVDRLGILMLADPRIGSPESTLNALKQALKKKETDELKDVKEELMTLREQLEKPLADIELSNKAILDEHSEEESEIRKYAAARKAVVENVRTLMNGLGVAISEAERVKLLDKGPTPIGEVANLKNASVKIGDKEQHEQTLEAAAIGLAKLDNQIDVVLQKFAPLNTKVSELAQVDKDTADWLDQTDFSLEKLTEIANLARIDTSDFLHTNNDLTDALHLNEVVTRLLKVRAEYSKAKSQYFKIGNSDRWYVSTYLMSLVEYMAFWQEDNVSRYWRIKSKNDLLTQQLCDRLNEIVEDKDFLERQMDFHNPPPSIVAKTPADRAAPLAVAAQKSTGTDAKPTESSAARDKLLNKANLLGLGRLEQHEVRQLNRFLLEDEFGRVFRARDQVRRVVTVQADQAVRLRWLFWSTVCFIAAGMWIDLNGVSPHRYYRDRVAKSFLVAPRGKSPSIPLSGLSTVACGAPYHLINAAVTITPTKVESEELMDPDEKSLNQKSIDTFLFSQGYCGSDATQYVKTSRYEHLVVGHGKRLDLAEATAISGAALSAGHQRNWLLSFLILAFNLNMGQWVPNPTAPRPRFRPRVIGLLTSFLKKSADRSYCYVSDGGHAENTGLVQLLKRRCKLIFVADASCDPKHQFADLGRALRLARLHDGIRFLSLDQGTGGLDQEFDPTALRLGEDGNCEKHFVMARICYPKLKREEGDSLPPTEGLLVYFKPCFTGDESADLKQFRDLNQEFPHEPTSDQLFEPEQVESYRYLGYHSAMQLHSLFPAEVRVGELWDYGPDMGAEQLIGWFRANRNRVSTGQRTVGVGNPVEATVAEIRETRPLAKELIGKMRERYGEPADIQPSTFQNVVRDEEEFKDVNIVQAVTAVQCAVLDKTRTVADREYCIWLLDALEADTHVPTNLDENIQLLFEIIQPSHPDRVRQAGISSLAILGRGKLYRKEAIRRLEDVQALEKSSKKSVARTRLALKNAISNLKAAPTKPR